MPALSHLGGVILAGGQARRFGGEKAMAPFQGRPLIDAVIDRLTDCAAIAVSTPPHSAAAAHAQTRGIEAIHDDPALPRGPLSGVCAALAWANARGFDLLATAPCDTPLLPNDLFQRLIDALGEADAAYAATADGDHPLCAVWRTSLLAPLQKTLRSGAHPSIRAFLQDRSNRVIFADGSAFANMNTAADLARLAGK
jgi:molybdopterin-guanine dinucleotide biosynthesis protein A